jgi:hypothetical protein
LWTLHCASRANPHADPIEAQASPLPERASLVASAAREWTPSFE